jgi:hypothetical protein
MERLAEAYRAAREDGDPNRTEYGFMVIVTMPNTFTKTQVEHDLRNSIAFGEPFVSLLYNVRAPRPEEVAKTTGERL